MGLYTKAKEIYHDVKDLRTDSETSDLITDILKISSFIIVGLLIVLQYWNFSDKVFLKNLPLFPQEMSAFLDKYAFGCLIGLITYKMFIRQIIAYSVICIKVDFKVNLLPVFYTTEKMLEICAMVILNLKFFGDLLLFINNINNTIIESKKIYDLYLVCILFIFVRWLYISNANNCYYNEISYTPYFDCLGNRIAEKDEVIYYGKLYNIHVGRKKVKENNVSIKEWYLCDINKFGLNFEDMTLEDAVKNKEGNLTVYEWGMGEKGNKRKSYK